MKRLIAVLVAGFLLVACTNSPPSAQVVTPEPKCRFHGALQEVGCLYQAEELVTLSMRNADPVWVYHGIPQRCDGAYLLRVSSETGVSSIVLDWSEVPETELIYGLDPLVGWKTRVVGRYTSRDIIDPSVPGASGTLVAVDIGFLYDPDRPQGPYHQLRQ